MADQEPTDNTGNWEPLKDYLQRIGFSRRMPFRVGHPVGEYRLDNLFALERKRPEVFVRGFPKEIIGEPQLLPRGEFYGYIVDDRGAEYRLTHVASRVIWYVVEVLEEPATAGNTMRPAPVPSADAPATVKSATVPEDHPPSESDNTAEKFPTKQARHARRARPDLQVLEDMKVLQRDKSASGDKLLPVDELASKLGVPRDQVRRLAKKLPPELRPASGRPRKSAGETPPDRNSAE